MVLKLKVKMIQTQTLKILVNESQKATLNGSFFDYLPLRNQYHSPVLDQLKSKGYFQNKKFLETNPACGRQVSSRQAIGVFPASPAGGRQFHFDLGVKNRPECSGLYFTSPETAKMQFRPLPRRGESETLPAAGRLEAEPRGILFD